MPANAPTARCQRPGCGSELQAHVDRKCPNGRGSFLVRKAVSQSFSAREVELLSLIFAGVQRKKDLSNLVRLKDYASLYRKIVLMKGRMAELEEASA